MKTHRAPAWLAGCLIVAASGCGAKPAPASSDGTPAVNRRYPMKDEYKQVLGKDGKMLWKPGMKLPPGAAKR